MQGVLNDGLPEQHWAVWVGKRLDPAQQIFPETYGFKTGARGRMIRKSAQHAVEMRLCRGELQFGKAIVAVADFKQIPLKRD
jgi:hypothetical protein